MIPQGSTSSYEYTDNPDLVGAPSTGFLASTKNQVALQEKVKNLAELMIDQFSTSIRGQILPKFHAIFCLQKEILNKLPLQKLAAYDQDNLQDPILDIFYPLDDKIFEDEFYSHLNLKKDSNLISLFRAKIECYVHPHLVALKAYSEIEMYLEEIAHPETIADIYPILGSYLKKNLDQIEILFSCQKIPSTTLPDHLFADLICRTEAYQGQKPQKLLDDIDAKIEEQLRLSICPSSKQIEATLKQQMIQKLEQEMMTPFESVLERIYEESKKAFSTSSSSSPCTYRNPEKFEVHLQPDLRPLLIIEEQIFGTLQIIPPHTNIALKLNQDIFDKDWLQLLDKKKMPHHLVVSLEFSNHSPWYKHPQKLAQFLSYFTNVEHLNLANFNFQKNTILTEISKLKKLKDLNLENGLFGEISEDFKQIGKIASIRKINLSKTDVTEKHVADLASFHPLTIYLANCSQLKKEKIKTLQNRFPRAFFHS